MVELNNMPLSLQRNGSYVINKKQERQNLNVSFPEVRISPQPAEYRTKSTKRKTFGSYLLWVPTHLTHLQKYRRKSFLAVKT